MGEYSSFRATVEIDKLKIDGRSPIPEIVAKRFGKTEEKDMPVEGSSVRGKVTIGFSFWLFPWRG